MVVSEKVQGPVNHQDTKFSIERMPESIGVPLCHGRAYDYIAQERPFLFVGLLVVRGAGRVGTFVAELVEFFKRYHARTYGWDGAPIHDALALAHAFLGYVYRRRGRLRDAEKSLRESLRLADRVGQGGLPMHWEAASMLIDTLLARGHALEAKAVADRYGFAPPSASTIYVPDAMSVRGRLLLALGHTEEGLNELEATAKALTARGQYNTVLAPWAYDLARALATEDPRRAGDLVADARVQAERFGTDTAIGEAVRCAASLETGSRAVALYAKAVTYLEASPCQYEHAVARVEYGIASGAVEELERGLALARACGADGLAARAEVGLAGV